MSKKRGCNLYLGKVGPEPPYLEERKKKACSQYASHGRWMGKRELSTSVVYKSFFLMENRLLAMEQQ